MVVAKGGTSAMSIECQQLVESFPQVDDATVAEIAARTLEGFAKVVLDWRVETKDPASRIGAEQTLRKVASVALEMAKQFREGVFNDE
jgi:hypothetical protein